MARLADFGREHERSGRIAPGSRPPRQSAGLTRAVAGQARAAYSRHEFAKNHRASRRFRMHPTGERRRRGFVPACFARNTGRLRQLGDWSESAGFQTGWPRARARAGETRIVLNPRTGVSRWRDELLLFLIERVA